MDGNSYQDISVGAPKSEEVFLYRTRPSVQLSVESKIENLKGKSLMKQPVKFGQDSEFKCSRNARKANAEVSDNPGVKIFGPWGSIDLFSLLNSSYQVIDTSRFIAILVLE